MTSLTTFYTNTAGTTLTTTNQLSITHGTDNTNVTQDYTLVGTASNFGELFSQGTASAWSGLASVGSPSGHGFMLEAATLNLGNNTISAGNWSANIRLVCGHTDGTLTGTLTGCEIHVRAFRYRAGSYNAIIDMLLTNQTINAILTTYALSGTGSSIAFLPGDLLYTDAWVKIGSNTNGDASLNIRLNRLSTNFTGDTNAQVVTPGYAATPALSGPTVMKQYLSPIGGRTF